MIARPRGVKPVSWTDLRLIADMLGEMEDMNG
jgi:hypothetical protein